MPLAIASRIPQRDDVILLTRENWDRAAGFVASVEIAEVALGQKGEWQDKRTACGGGHFVNDRHVRHREVNTQTAVNPVLVQEIDGFDAAVNPEAPARDERKAGLGDRSGSVEKGVAGPDGLSGWDTRRHWSAAYLIK
ncbi:MAG TPA: hypothetical protein VK009_17760 [Chloroflexota bacterium]|nr:hypothetical protein [Chloroflexota bacterium]